eukprot:TRINITY_DN1051_c0_g1_i1.p1 TRINITY_DN1051_c0_g1~~TRINITY_DN1051_c0_g1_i1.p1  ORF type:complete len:232 (+),score=59.04 TRINITY_DN1051_c0_g1_i1:96-698(+)
MEEAIRQSDQAFREQFDPNNPNHHGGPFIPVPIGGERVPQGLESQADWKSLPVQENAGEKVSYGPEYDSVEKMRNDLGELKKALTNVNIPVDALVTLRTRLASASDQDKEKAQKAVDAEVAKLNAALQNLQTYKNTFPQGSEFGKSDIIDEVSKGAVVEMDKEQQFTFGTMVKKHTSQIFREQKTLLERLKKIKKDKGAN